MEKMTAQDIGLRLKDRFETLKRTAGTSKAEFARLYKVPGGASMISQHISGNRPVGVEAAICYANGFNCTIAEINPDLAGMVQRATSISSDAQSNHYDTTRNYPSVVGTARMGDKGYYLDLECSNGYVEFEAEAGSIAIHVRGDSMHPAIRDGWYVIIEPSGKPTAGEYVLLEFNDGKKMVKELLMEKYDCYVVMSVNSGERITAMKDELTNIRAISAVVPPSKHKH